MAGWRDVIGSDLEAFRKDESGKTRTADEIIQAALDAALEADRRAGGAGRGGSYDAQGNFIPVDDRQLANQILMQLKSNAEQNKGNTSISADVYKKLGGNKGQGNFSQYVDPSQWRYKIGEFVQGPEDKARGKTLDPKQKFLSKEELAYYNERVQNPDSPSERYGYVDPVTGYSLYVNPFTGEIDWNRTNDPNAFLNADNPNFKQYGTGGVGGGSFRPGFNMGGDPSTLTAGDGTQFDNFSDYLSYQNKLDYNTQERKSAYDTLYNEFNKYGLGSLVESIKGLIQSNVSPSEFSIALQNTKEYQQRFKANQDRIAKGLRALTPAEYIGLEDQYQNIMRNYGLPASYYTKDSMGTQEGFNKFISNDVSASELEDRIATAQQRVLNSNPEVLQALKQFYPDISNADILAYVLDPSQALTNIKRKVTAAEIGGAALAQGLQAQGGTAESLAGYGITKQQAQQGYADIASILPRGSQLADIYKQQPYNQATAEAEVFNIAGSADAAARRKKLASLEQAQFAGSSGVGALGRDKSLYAAMQGQAGLY